MLLSWRPPSPAHGVIEGYSVGYYRSGDVITGDGANDDDMTIITVGPLSSPLQYNVTGLLPYTTYQLQVSRTYLSVCIKGKLFHLISKSSSWMSMRFVHCETPADRNRLCLMLIRVFCHKLQLLHLFEMLTATCRIFPALHQNSHATCRKHPAIRLPFVLVPVVRNILSLAYVFVIGKKCWASIWLPGFFNDSR